MKILLTGASGFVGGHLIQALTATGHTVIPICRSHGFDFNRMQSIESWLPLLAGVDTVINSVGIIAEMGSQTFTALHQNAPISLFRACLGSGVQRVIQISALGADDQASTPYHLTKKAADDELRGLPLKWFILRPSLIYGPGSKSMALFQRLARLPLMPVIGNGQQLIQPVHVSDVVATVLHSLQTDAARCTLDVVGPEQMTFVDWLQAIRRKLGKSAAPVLPIPVALVIAATLLGKRFVPELQPDNIRMLQQGNIAAVKPLQQFLGRSPIAWQEGLDLLSS